MIKLLIFQAIEASILAGKAILEVYSRDFEVKYKEDHSPLTLADKSAHEVICRHLSGTGIPVLSEEGTALPYEKRKLWKRFWMVDPLDGTKEFVSRNGDFTVNIALVEDGFPLAGVIYAPVPELLYFALPGYGAFRVSGSDVEKAGVQSLEQIIGLAAKLPDNQTNGRFVVVGSRSHLNPETRTYIEGINQSKGELTFESRGSSLKFCTLAEGSADLYPRLGPTMEWDTAAGHAIALLAGCSITDPFTLVPLIYNKESLLNPCFVVSREQPVNPE